MGIEASGEHDSTPTASSGATEPRPGGLSDVVSEYLQEAPRAEPEPETDEGVPSRVILSVVAFVVLTLSVALVRSATGWEILQSAYERHIAQMATEASNMGSLSYPQEGSEPDALFEFTGGYRIHLDGQDNRDGIASIEVRWIETGDLGHIFAIYESTGYFGSWELQTVPRHCRTPEGGSCDDNNEYWLSVLSGLAQG